MLLLLMRKIMQGKLKFLKIEKKDLPFCIKII